MENNWDLTFIKTTKLFSENSKCAAKKVACVLVKDGNIISIGLNGTLPGAKNCNEIFEKKDGNWYKKITTYNRQNENDTLLSVDKDDHHNWSLFNEIHAEINALSHANKNNVNVQDSTAYITHSPCFNCAKTLVAFGIKEIHYIEKYDDFDEVESFLKSAGIKVVQHTI